MQGVELVEIGGKTYNGYQYKPGWFNFIYIPATGKNYKLRITLKKDIYESETVMMPPIPDITSIYSGYKEKKVYLTDAYGAPQAYNMPGCEFYVDAPLTSTLSHYRFDVRSVLEWTWDSTVTTAPPPPTVYGWNSYTNDRFNLAGPKQFSVTGQIEKHPIMMLSYKAKDYLHSDTLISHGWIMIIEQYGTSKESFDYHGKLNAQFEASGSLFDPIQTQVYGNITCKNDPAKIAYGYFDLNSYVQYRYYVNLSSPNTAVVLKPLFRYPEITDFGQIKGSPPDWWEW